MRRLVFLLEEYSMKVLLDTLLPKFFPDLAFLCVPHEGKHDLQKSIPRKLRAWREPGVRFVVVCDNDGNDCLKVKGRLEDLCNDGRRQDTVVPLACQELEAWYFGAPKVMAEVFERPDLANLDQKARFRDPDAIDRPSMALAEIVEEFQKVSGARRMAQRLVRENRSASFQILMSRIEELASQMRTAIPPQGDNG